MSVGCTAVIGAGTMGSGIALAAATHGIEAIVVDVAKGQLERARNYHQAQLARGVEKGRMEQEDADAAASRITYRVEMADSGQADWAIEAATERIEIKKDIFATMQATFGDGVVLATNTSSISIGELASAVPGAEDRVIGMHFFNPVPVMKLVEVIKGAATSEETTSRTIALAEAMGKTPVPANDFAGFVSNRVLMPMINEAFHAWVDGVAEPEHIDEIMKLGCAFPMGPLRLADYIGLDVCRDIMHVMHRGLGDEKYLPCPRIEELIADGRLGDKSGRGVYDYADA